MCVTHITTISLNEINPNLKITFCLDVGIIGVVNGSLLHHPYELDIIAFPWKSMVPIHHYFVLPG